MQHTSSCEGARKYTNQDHPPIYRGLDTESVKSDGDDSGDCVRVSSSFTSSSYTPPATTLLWTWQEKKDNKIWCWKPGSDISKEPYSEFVTSPRYSSSSCCSDNDSSKPLVEPSTYKDVLILFWFNDHDLPFRLKEVILSDRSWSLPSRSRPSGWLHWRDVRIDHRPCTMFSL